MSRPRAFSKAADPSVREVLDYVTDSGWTDRDILRTAGLEINYLYALRQRRYNPQVAHLNSILGVFGLRLGIVKIGPGRGRPIRRKKPFAGKETK